MLATDEPHTLTFLTAGQVRLPFFVGCPGFSTSPATFDGSTCISAPPSGKGQTFNVTFPAAGNFKLVCLSHENMTATVPVLDPSQMHGSASVIVGGGEVIATAGGSDILSVLRFRRAEITIHAGETVEWTNIDPITPHTITLGRNRGILSAISECNRRCRWRAPCDAHFHIRQCAFRLYPGSAPRSHWTSSIGSRSYPVSCDVYPTRQPSLHLCPA